MKIYADTSKLSEIFDLYENNKLVEGFTTNPSLMRKAGITNYVEFIKEVTNKIKDKPFSFEIFADEPKDMEYQIQKLAEFGENIYVKVPVMNTKGVPTYDLINKMNSKFIKMNITAVFTKTQIENVCENTLSGADTIISVFCGRIADTGKNPKDMIECVNFNKMPWVESLWASVREVFNIYEAKSIGCDIITVTPDIIQKYQSFQNKNLEKFSKETVQMFYDDAKASGLVL